MKPIEFIKGDNVKVMIVEIAEYYDDSVLEAMEILFKNLQGVKCEVTGTTEDGGKIFVLENVTNDIKKVVEFLEDSDLLEILRR